jgi:hypothetical protein
MFLENKETLCRGGRGGRHQMAIDVLSKQALQFVGQMNSCS